MQFLLFPKYQYSLYHFKWCLYKLLTGLYCDQSEVTKNIMESFSLLSWSQKHPRFHTLVQTCWLCSVKWCSFSDRFFLIWCGWHQYNPVEMTFHFIVHCLCTCTLWIVFIRGIVRKWTFLSRHWLLPAWYYARLHSWGIHVVLEEYNSLWQYCHMIYKL